MLSSLEGRENWLDGLRGIAATVVTIGHFIAGEFPAAFRSFWDQPAQDNRRWYQMTPFRLVFAQSAMVLVLMTVSGYAISIRLARSRYDTLSSFYNRLSSSAFRRTFRLYIPVIIVTVVTHSLHYVGAYNTWRFTDDECPPDVIPWSNLWPHIRYMFNYIMRLLDPVHPNFVSGLSIQLWTIPYELRGSFTVYLVFLALAAVRLRMRLVVIWLLGFYSLWTGDPDQACFFGGMALAEFESSSAHERDTTTKHDIKSALHVRSSTAGSIPYLLLAIGTALLCLPFPTEGSTMPPDYWFQSFITIPMWSSNILRGRSWMAIGAIMIVHGLAWCPRGQALLAKRLPQFLGRIAFSMYLIHIAIIRMLRNPMLTWICNLLQREDYCFTKSGKVAETVWVVTGGILGTLTIFISKHGELWLDKMGVLWAGRIESFVKEKQ